MVFDARQAKALAAGGHIIVEEAPGLRLVATSTTRTWTYRFKSPVDGRMRQVALGKWPEVPYTMALARWGELRRQRDDGLDPAMLKKQQGQEKKQEALQARKGKYLVATLIEEYLQGHVLRHRKPKGYTETRRLMSPPYTAAIWSMEPHQVKRKDAFALLEELGGRAPVLANSLRTELGAAWDYALDAGRIPEETPNWWRQILRGKLRSRGKIVGGEHQGRVLRHLSSAEVAKLLAFLPNFTALIEDLLTLYLWTGARGAEIVQMEAHEITSEEDGWWWTVPREKLKMARSDLLVDQRVPLVGRALAVVQRRLALHPTGYLFRVVPRRGACGHVAQKVVGVAIWSVRPDTVTDRLPAGRTKVLDIPAWAAHDLRRTVKTTLASLGCPESVSEAVLGHIPPGVLAVYNRHTYDKERREWLTRLAEHWELLAAGHLR